MSSVQVGFIKWRLSVLNFEIKSLMKSASTYHKRGNKTALDETIAKIAKLKSERASWFDRLAEAELELDTEEE